jgi:hypothetical protein
MPVGAGFGNVDFAGRFVADIRSNSRNSGCVSLARLRHFFYDPRESLRLLLRIPQLL